MQLQLTPSDGKQQHQDHNQDPQALAGLTEATAVDAGQLVGQVVVAVDRLEGAEAGGREATPHNANAAAVPGPLQPINSICLTLRGPLLMPYVGAKKPPHSVFSMDILAQFNTTNGL